MWIWKRARGAIWWSLEEGKQMEKWYKCIISQKISYFLKKEIERGKEERGKWKNEEGRKKENHCAVKKQA